MQQTGNSFTIEVKFYNNPNIITYNIPWSPGLYIQGAMEACYNSTPGPGVPPFTYEIQYYGTYNTQLIGYMAVAINGVFRAAGYIWYVYLNNVLTNNSLDAVQLNPGDAVEFKYETYAEAEASPAGSFYHSFVHAEKALLQSFSHKNKLVMATPPANTFVRDTLADQGYTPNTGGLNVSPDIIPQLSPANPAQVQQLFGTATYGQDIATQQGINIEQGQSNYIYLRAKNPTSAAATVQLSVYWAAGSTLQTPSQWINQQIGNSQQITIPANSVLAAPAPAIWSPLQLPDLGHYCLITQVTWAGFAGVTAATTFPNINAWWQYCQNNNTIAQRNIDIVNVQPNNRTEWNLDLLNPDPNALLHTIIAVCNVPGGSTVALYCSAPQLNPPISTGPVNIAGTNNGQNVMASTMFPANFQGTLQVIFQPPGNAQPGLYSIVLQQYAATTGGNYQFLGSYTFDINIGVSAEQRMKLIKAKNKDLMSKLSS